MFFIDTQMPVIIELLNFLLQNEIGFRGVKLINFT